MYTAATLGRNIHKKKQIIRSKLKVQININKP